jgi:hypothetical protein
MTSKHLSDYDIQQLVLDEANCDHSIIQHARLCPRCNSKAETYRLIFVSLEGQPKPVFEFDLTGLVLSKLVGKEETLPLSNRLTYLTVTIIAAPLAAVSYLFGENLLDIFSSVSSILLYMMVATTSTFLAFQIIEMFKKHKKQMADLDLGETTATFMGHSGHIKNTTLN